MIFRRFIKIKKLLPTITAVILGTTFSPNISNAFSNNSNFTSNNWTWNNVQVNHNVATPATGTHEESNTKTDTKATVQPWYIFLNSQQIISNVYFALHTYDGAVYLNQVVLNLKQDVATDIFRQWDFSQTNDVWQGWGHQINYYPDSNC
ncbi:hypothetical protein [Spiroplasma endosymbiont of Virgichneumon dumeticola]|uniref:hypothetical protein n=1 Tax=Spiroplasma endosymbiont of Virgichneumon dumeticola TaxID=3139323 RepID=UPI0035C89871